MYKILLDFDDTLIETDKLRKSLFSFAQKLGSTFVDAQKYYHSLIDNHVFTIEDYASKLFKVEKIQKAFVAKYKSLFTIPKKYNFYGVEDFLEKLSRKYILILFTHGAQSNQWRKINQSGLKKYFQQIIITRNKNKKPELKETQEKFDNKILLLDDSDLVEESANELKVKFIKISKEKDRNYYKDLLNSIKKALD